EIANEFQFRAREYLARGVVGSIQDDGLGVRAKGGAQFALVEGPIAFLRDRRTQLNELRFGAGKKSVRPVVLVKRLEDNDFVPGVAERHQGRDHALGGTAANCYFAVWIRF